MRGRSTPRSAATGLERITLSDLDIGAPETDLDVLAVNDALDRLAAEDPRLAEMVNLRFFAGMSIADTARALDYVAGNGEAGLGVRARLALRADRNASMTLKIERELFEAAILLPADARESWLAEHCDDAAMRARVLRLLAAHDSAEARDTLRTPTPMSMPIPMLTDRQIGPYRLLERIGEGAMGEVYLAEQIRARGAARGVEGDQARHGLARGHRAFRSGAADAGADESSEHRAHHRRGHDRRRATVLRDGVRAGHFAHEILRPASPRHRPAARRCSCRSAMPCSTRTRKA